MTVAAGWASGAGQIADVPVVNIRQPVVFAYVQNGRVSAQATLQFANQDVEISQVAAARRSLSC